MSVARVTELSAVSEKGFEDAINQAVARATKTLRQHRRLQGQRGDHLRVGGRLLKSRGLSRHWSALVGGGFPD
jgi:flavin-binding protein dodecin